MPNIGTYFLWICLLIVVAFDGYNAAKFKISKDKYVIASLLNNYFWKFLFLWFATVIISINLGDLLNGKEYHAIVGSWLIVFTIGFVTGYDKGDKNG